MKSTVVHVLREKIQVWAGRLKWYTKLLCRSLSAQNNTTNELTRRKSHDCNFWVKTWRDHRLQLQKTIPDPMTIRVDHMRVLGPLLTIRLPSKTSNPLIRSCTFCGNKMAKKQLHSGRFAAHTVYSIFCPPIKQTVLCSSASNNRHDHPLQQQNHI